MLSADSLYARNIEFAGGLSYDLKRVHGVSVASTLETISDNLMIDAEALSVCLRVCAAFHEDEAKVLMANVPQRAKSIGDFTLLVTSMGNYVDLFCFQRFARYSILVDEDKQRICFRRIKNDISKIDTDWKIF